MLRRFGFLALLVTLLLPVAWVAGGRASSAPKWAAAGQATIHPGVNLNSKGNVCTSNFIFNDAKNVYIGQAAHCSNLDGNLHDDCVFNMMPLGTNVRIDGARYKGRLVYNSWNTMTAAKVTDGTMCLGNDFALIRIDPRDHGRVNPSVPFWGGPSGLAKSVTSGTNVYVWSNSPTKQGISALSPQIGLNLGLDSGGWNFRTLTASPGVPGDSGSAILGPGGSALGVYQGIGILPVPAASTNTFLSNALRYMYEKTKLDAVRVAKGTVVFSGLPLDRLTSLL